MILNGALELGDLESEEGAQEGGEREMRLGLSFEEGN